jgi:hypothetical protein
MNDMQEQPHYKITPDQAWAKMKPLLDEAMPESSRRRLPVWMWWSTSTLAVLLLTGFSYMALSSSTSSVPAKLPSSNSSEEIMPVNAVVDPSSATTPNINERQVKTNQSSPQDIHTNTETKNIQTTNHKNPPSRPLNRTSNPVQKAASPPMAAATAFEQAAPVFVMANQTIEEAGTDRSFVSSAEPTPVVVSRNNWITDALSSEPQIDLELEHQPDFGVGPITPGRANNNSSFVSPYLTVSGFSGFNQGLGFMAGAGVDLNINRKFSTNIAAGYFSYKPEAQLLGSTKNLDLAPGYNPILYYPTQESQYAYVNEGLVNNASGYNDIQTLVDRLDQFQISAGVKYKMSSRFFTEAGFQLGLFTKVYSNYSFATIDPLSNAIEDVRQNVVLNDYNVVRSTTSAVYAGLGYRLGQHIELFGGITYGLDHYLVNETNTMSSTDQLASDRSDYIRGFNLGLRYHL